MIKAAEGTVAKVGQLADNAIVAIGKARSDLQSVLPFLKPSRQQTSKASLPAASRRIGESLLSSRHFVR
jgi:hypothetical protein